ncbi:hypothetical protein ACUXZZ_45555 (plasmid) [Streptomyces graminifolii]|uniref:hypothetical protein n=1 Tax=Streptomyces graminifolii TaxID=1266771 RepID=UPI0040591AAC
MRLYTLTGATALDDAEYGTFHADENGGFDFPDDVSDRLHQFHLHGRPMWETDTERQRRQVVEEMERRKDPSTLLSAVEQLVRAAQATASLTPGVAQATADVQKLAEVTKAPETEDDPNAQSKAPADDAPKPSTRKRSTSTTAK